MSEIFQIDLDLFVALMRWQQEGTRTVEIRVNRFSTGKFESEIWISDSSLCVGKFIKTIEDIPDHQALLRERKRQLELQVEELNDYLEQEMEVRA